MKLKQAQAMVRNNRSPFCMCIETGVIDGCGWPIGNCAAIQPASLILSCICMSTFGTGHSMSSGFLFFFPHPLLVVKPSLSHHSGRECRM